MQNSAFNRRRLGTQSAVSSSRARGSSAPSKNKSVTLESISHLSQVLLAVVAIFGYFYTVRPIYQKDRLEEKVAEYEGVIVEQKNQVLSARSELAALDEERRSAATELSALNAKLGEAEKQVATVQRQKNKIEDQIQYMDYALHLPDGSPATTPEKVELALDIRLKDALINKLSMCTLRVHGPFNGHVYREEIDASFPFTSEELAAWTKTASKLPINSASTCIRQHGQEFVDKVKGDSRSAKLAEELLAKVQSRLDSAGVTPWVPSKIPGELIAEFREQRATVEQTRINDLARVEREDGDWQSTWGEANRAIREHNYKQGKRNAEMNANASFISLEYDYKKRANDFRDAFAKERSRLVKDSLKSL